jgi:hypothetical protein
MEATATAAAMKTATSAAMTTASVLSNGQVGGESETDENCQRYQGIAKSGWAHNLYLPLDVGVQLRARSLSARTARLYFNQILALVTGLREC